MRAAGKGIDVAVFFPISNRVWLHLLRGPAIPDIMLLTECRSNLYHLCMHMYQFFDVNPLDAEDVLLGEATKSIKEIQPLSSAPWPPSSFRYLKIINQISRAHTKIRKPPKNQQHSPLSFHDFFMWKTRERSNGSFIAPLDWWQRNSHHHHCGKKGHPSPHSPRVLTSKKSQLTDPWDERYTLPTFFRCVFLMVFPWILWVWHQPKQVQFFFREIHQQKYHTFASRLIPLKKCINLMIRGFWYPPVSSQRVKRQTHI